MESPDPMLQFFEYEHLPERLQAVSKPFCLLARQMVTGVLPGGDTVWKAKTALPRNPERTAALRKLLEAKDCAVRALLYQS